MEREISIKDMDTLILEEGDVVIVRVDGNDVDYMQRISKALNREGRSRQVRFIVAPQSAEFSVIRKKYFEEPDAT